MTRGQSSQPQRQSTRTTRGKKRVRLGETEVGEGSNQGGNAPRTFEQRNFPEAEDLEHYNTKFKNKDIRAGRVTHYPSLERVRFPYFNEIGEQGWTAYIQLSNEYYPDLIRAFYSNGRNRYVTNLGREYTATNKFETTVNGVDMEITPELIDSIFDFPTEGVDEGDISLTNRANLDRDALIYENRNNPKSANRFSFHDRLLHMIIASTLRPVGQKYSKWDNEQLFFMKCIKTRRHVRLSAYIVHDMSRIVSGKIKILYYGRLITRILQHFHVDLSMDESRTIEDDKKPISDEAFNKIPYMMQADGTWILNRARLAQIEAAAAARRQREGEQDGEEGVAPPPLPPQGDQVERTITDLYNLMLGQREDFNNFNTRFGEFQQGVNTRFEDANTRFIEFQQGVYTRLDEVNTRIDGVNTRLDEYGVRLSDVEAEFRSFHQGLPPPE